MSPRVVLITNDSRNGQRLADVMHRRGTPFDAVLLLTGGFGLPPSRSRGVLRRLLSWPRSVHSTIRRKVRFHRHRKGPYGQRSPRVIATGAMNGARLVRDLRALEPDFIVLGGGGILLPSVIGTARMGVLNAHPALLPWVRGTQVVGRSLEVGIPLGATVHLVDATIDTGPIVARRLVPVAEGPATLAALDEAAWTLAAEMMADVVEPIKRRGELPVGVAQAERFPLYGNPAAAERQGWEALAAAGRAGDLFRLWSPHCTEGERWVLPLDAPPPAGAAGRRTT